MKNLLNWITVIGIIVTIIFLIMGIKAHDSKLIVLALITGVIGVTTYSIVEVKYEEK